MKKLLFIIFPLMLSLAGYSQNSTRGALITVDTANYSNSAGFTKPTIKMLAVYIGDNKTYYWNGSSWGPVTTGGSGSSVALSSITAATGSNTINNGNNNQIWQWNSLTNANGLSLASNSTTAGIEQILLSVGLSGANAAANRSTTSAYFENNHTGTNSTNIAARFSASSGTTNYAIDVQNGGVRLQSLLPSHGAADSMLVKNSSDEVGYRAIPSSGAPSLPSTYIGYGDGSNLLTGSSDLTWDGTVFKVGQDGVNLTMFANQTNNNAGFGDLDVTGNGNRIQLINTTDIAYYDNTAHTGKFGINTATPTVALDVVGDVNIINSDNVQLNTSTTNWNLGDGNGSAYSFVSGNTASKQTNIGNADNATLITIDGGTAKLITLTSDNGVLVPSLSGTGTRAVLADASGLLSAPISDRSVKQNIQPLDYGLNTLLKLKPVSFEYKPEWQRYGTGKQIGFIAQDVQKVLPNSVFTTPQTGKLGINKEDIIPVLVQAVQELSAKVDKLEKQNAELVKKLNKNPKKITLKY